MLAFRVGDLFALRSRLPLMALALASAVIARAPEAKATEALDIVLPPASIAAVPATPSPVAPDVLPPIAFDRWRGLSFGTYLAPKDDFVTADGGVDVVFHFHAGQMAERQLKESGVNAVFVS